MLLLLILPNPVPNHLIVGTRDGICWPLVPRNSEELPEQAPSSSTVTQIDIRSSTRSESTKQVVQE